MIQSPKDASAKCFLISHPNDDTYGTHASFNAPLQVFYPDAVT
jgi:hypothetical protein